jgi:hypothetical protein
MTLFKKSACGATVEWDLYYYTTNDFAEQENNNPDEGEQIEKMWVSFEEASNMCINGKISEERSAIVLLNFLSGKA